MPPPETIEHLETFLEPRREAAEFRWSDPDQWHVTLAFAAAVEEWRVESLAAALADVATRHARFDLAIAGGGAFPDPDSARVLYAGLDVGADPEAPARLATSVRAAFARAGAEVDGGRFRPHLTLARLRRPTSATRWLRILDSYRGPVWTASEIVLVHSHLGEGARGRPRHEILERISLPTAAPGAGATTR